MTVGVLYFYRFELGFRGLLPINGSKLWKPDTTYISKFLF